MSIPPRTWTLDDFFGGVSLRSRWQLIIPHVDLAETVHLSGILLCSVTANCADGCPQVNGLYLFSDRDVLA